jgi:hypothetical protein
MPEAAMRHGMIWHESLAAVGGTQISVEVKQHLPDLPQTQRKILRAVIGGNANISAATCSLIFRF